MKYYETSNGVTYDSLIGGTQTPFRVENVSISSGAYERGTLLALGSSVYSAADGSDYNEPLAILRSDIGSSDSRVTQVYTRGEFNESAIIVGSSVDLDDYRENLRREGIYLTDIKEGY